MIFIHTLTETVFLLTTYDSLKAAYKDTDLASADTLMGIPVRTFRAFIYGATKIKFSRTQQKIVYVLETGASFDAVPISLFVKYV